MNEVIKTVNNFVDEISKRKGMEPIEVLMDLALIAGFKRFNPHRTTEHELREIANAIPLYFDEY